MRFYWLAIGILAVWRITHLLNAEDGPWNLLARLRRAAGSGGWASLLDCFYCLSVWIAAPPAYWIAESWREAILLWPALSAGAILAERLTAKTTGSSAAISYEEPDQDDELLRESEKSVSGAARPQ